MATLTDRVIENAAGRFYCDASCIDCDQCRTQAPDFFGRNEDGMSFLKRQPVTPEEIALVEETMSGCATSSIGDDGE